MTVVPHAEPESPGTAAVRVRWSGIGGEGELAVACAGAEIEVTGNCGHLETGEQSCRLAWWPEAVRVVAGSGQEMP
jgi:hypothetical protein